jgi:molybdopterin-guanine dinucleotide biosynthesis protein A
VLSSPEAAVIVAGGQGRRLGGRDKPALVVHGRALLDRALDAVSGVPVVVVGPRRTLPAGVVGAAEDPPGGGPAAAVAAGFAALPELPADAIVAVLAADLPGIDASTLARLCAALLAGSGDPDSADPDSGSGDPDSADTYSADTYSADPGGAVLLDPSGHRQYLIGVWRRGPLAAAITRRPQWHDAPLRDLLAPIRVVEVPGSDREAADIDTPADLRRWLT